MNALGDLWNERIDQKLKAGKLFIMAPVQHYFSSGPYTLNLINALTFLMSFVANTYDKNITHPTVFSFIVSTNMLLLCP